MICKKCNKGIMIKSNKEYTCNLCGNIISKEVADKEYIYELKLTQSQFEMLKDIIITFNSLNYDLFRLKESTQSLQEVVLNTENNIYKKEISDGN